MSPSIPWTFAAWLLATSRRPKAGSCQLHRIPSWRPQLSPTRELGLSSIHSSSPISIPDSMEGQEAVVVVAVMVAAEVARVEAVATAAEPVEGQAAVVTAEEREEPPAEEIVAAERV